MKIEINIEKKHAFAIILAVVLVSVITIVSATSPLAQFTPLSQITTDDAGFNVIDNGNGYIRADVIEGGGSVSIQGFSETTGYETGVGAKSYCASKGFSHAIALSYGGDKCTGTAVGWSGSDKTTDFEKTVVFIGETDNRLIYAGSITYGSLVCYLGSTGYDTIEYSFNILCSGAAFIPFPGQLTWNGIGGPSTHTEDECHAIGGGVYDTGVSGTICKIVGTDLQVPSGWQQAESWQRYNPSTWGGDICGHHKSYGPATFSNDVSKKYTTAAYIGMPNTNCNSNTGNWHTAGNAPYNHRLWTIAESPGDSFNRYMLGIY